MSKRILITSFTYPPHRNGVAHVVEAHARGLARLGYEVTVATGAIAGEPHDCMLDGVRVRRFAVRGNGRWLRGRYTGHIRLYQNFIIDGLWDIIICHCWQIWSTDLAINIFPKLNYPIKIFVSHGVSAKNHPKTIKGVFNWIDWYPYVKNMPAMINTVNHFVLLSDMQDSNRFYDHQLMHKIGYLNHSVIPNGVHPENYNNPAERANAFRTVYGINDKIMLLCVSHYSQDKNQLLAAKAFMEAKLEDAVLVFIGGEINDYVREIMTFIETHREHFNEILFLENLSQPDIISAYCAADIFLFTSMTECQPMVIIEAMAASTPFITRDIGCVREFPGGIVVKNDNELPGAISQLANNKSIRDKLGKEGTQAVESRYNWDAVLLKYDALIKQLCSARH